MEFSKEYTEKRNEILNDFYGLNCAEKIIQLPLSKMTKAALHLRGKVKDTLDAFFLFHELMFGVMEMIRRKYFQRR